MYGRIMKIGILTQPLHNNYGGILQNYALQQILIQMGIDPVTIDHTSRRLSWWKNILFKTYYFGWLLLHPSFYKDQKYQPTSKENAIICKNTGRFINKYINKTDPFHCDKDLQVIIKDGNFDGYVVGSDQCWRPIYSGGFLKEMFLNFASEDTKRVAYAASFGTDQWEFTSQMTEECARLAKRFDLITVREASGVTLCREHLGVEAKHVLDPTMLLNREDYENVVKAEQEPASPGTLFYYILDPSDEKRGLMERMAAECGMQLFSTMPKFQVENRTKWAVKHRIEDCVFPSVTSWLRGFMDAEMTVIDSFHGVVFSIIFNKPFWVIGNKKRGNARFESLLGMFGLEDRMISPDDFSAVDWQSPINWHCVNEIREREKARCVGLLKDAFRR